mmetsp:Transcript_45298/g.54943  ORF Transcript_45298/g.54943 Transcript_45298/m.54943 type:complete len:95 (-) Transcript_45298:42-326(-)
MCAIIINDDDHHIRLKPAWNDAVNKLHRGVVACNANNRSVANITNFEAQVIVIKHIEAIYSGRTPVLDCHMAHFASHFANIKTKINRRTNKIIK